MFYLSALAMGLLGSMHCIGMCGPIVLIIHSNKSFLGKISYHAGRIIVYAMIGMIAGSMGGAIHLGFSQEIISIAAGVLMLIMIIAPTALLSKVPFLRYIGIAYSKIQAFALPLWKQKSMKSSLFLGMLNGILPCGFLYAALLGALSADGPLGGMAWMLLFGIGTTPSLLLAGTTVSLLSNNAQQSFKRLLPYGTVLLAILFILRGMALGIPFISPVLPNTMPTTFSTTYQIQEHHQCCVPEKK